MRSHLSSRLFAFAVAFALIIPAMLPAFDLARHADAQRDGPVIDWSGTAAPGGVLRAADISGNTYTSPSFGETVSWNNQWFAESEKSTASFDRVTITNGVTFLSVIFEENDYLSPDLVLALFSGDLRTDSQITSVEPILDASGNAIRGSEDGRSYAAFSYLYTYDSGNVMAFGTYIESRVVREGEVMMTLVALMPLDFFFTEYQLAGVTVPAVSLAPVVKIVAGEPAPVFVDGFWRVGVATAVRGPEFQNLGLAEKDGKVWFVVIVDVANWSGRAELFPGRDIRLALTGADKPVRPAPASTRALSTRLELGDLSKELTATIGAGASRRVPLIYQVNASLSDPALTLGQAQIPIGDLIAMDIDPAALPPTAVPAETQPGTIVSASDGKTMRVQITDESSSQRIRLLGVEPPAEGECLANGAETLLDDLTGREVLVEEDATVTGGTAAQRYVWLINDDGTRTLLNQRLIAEGLAQAAAIPSEARFALWLESTEFVAEEARVGLWAGCETKTPEAAATKPTATLTPSTGGARPSPTAAAPVTPTATVAVVVTKTAVATKTAAATEATAWHADISDLGTLDFTTEGDMVTKLALTVDPTCSQAGGTYFASGSPVSLPISITADQFTATIPIGKGLEAKIAAQVMGDTMIAGTITVPALPGCTTGTVQRMWTATPE